MKNRKFSIPYSPLIDPVKYLRLISKYKNNIDSIFLGIPELENHLSIQIGYNTDISKNFLSISKGLYNRIVVYNTIFNNDDINNILKYFEKTIYPMIELYQINGFILTNLGLAIKLHKDFPKLQIQTSCNCYQWTIRQMELWRELAGVTLFNPPRESGRMPLLLKTMHEYGFKLKVLVNEACIFGCPYQYNHACAIASNDKAIITNCSSNDLSNALRTNLILPKWLKHLDEYVDVYKLSGRASSFESLKKIFEAYIEQKEYMYIDEYACFGNNSPISILKNKGIRIKESDIPDKVRFCESKDCNRTCFECSNNMERITSKI